MTRSPFAPLFASLRSRQTNSHRKRRLFRPIEIELLEDRVVPASHVWVGTDNNGLWNDANNWTGGAPTVGETGVTLTFGTGETGTRALLDNIPGLVVDSITFSDTGYSLAGSAAATTLTLSGAISPAISDTVGGNSILGTNLTIPLAATAQINIAAGTDTISTVFSGSGGITKVGSGTLVLSGASTYTGLTTIASGIVRLGASTTAAASGPLGSATGATVVSAGATLDFNGFKISPAAVGTLEPISFSGTGFNGQGALLVSTTGPGNSDTSALTLLGNATIVVNAGTFTFTGALGGAGFNLTLDGTATGTFSGAASIGTGSITKVGTGTWALGGAASSFFGGVTVASGTVKTTTAGTGGNGPLGAITSNVVVSSGASIDLNGVSLANPYPITVSGIGTGGGALTNSSATAATFSGVVTAGSNSLIGGTGPGTISLAGNVSATTGTLQLGSFAVLANGTGSVNNLAGTDRSANISSGATLDLNGASNATKVINVGGTGVGGNGALVNSSATAATVSSTGSLADLFLSSGGSGYAAAPTVTITDPGGGTGAVATASLGLSAASFAINSGSEAFFSPPAVTISGGGSTSTALAVATLNSSGVVTGITITYPGIGYTTAPTIAFTIVASNVKTPGIPPSGTGNATNFIVSDLVLSAAGANYTPATTVSITGASTVAAAATASPTVVNLSAPASIGGTGDITIPAVTGGFGLTKVGSNTLTVTGTSTFTGPTTVSAGVLDVNGSLNAASAVTVASGSTLGGSGTVNGAVTDNGIIYPGAVGAAGTLTLAGGLAFGASSALNVDVSGAASDEVVVTGSTVLSATTLNVTGVSPTAATYTLLHTTAGITSQFSNASEGSHDVVDGKAYAVHYTTTDVQLLLVVGSTVSVTWLDGASAVFNGNSHAATASWSSTGADSAGGPLPVTYVGINGTAYGPSSIAPTNSGNYEASATFAGDATHTGSTGATDFTINRLSPTSTETFVVTSVALQPSANLALDNDFTRFANAFADVRAGDTVQIDGTLDWSESHALASWQATGEAFAMPHLNGITVDAAAPGNGIHGPGDDPTISGEGPFYFDGLGTDKSWNITGLAVSNFDTALFYAPETDVTSYAGTHITNNTITVPSANPGAQNGGILLGPSANQTVQGNTIDITGNGGASAASFGISSFTYDGNGAWNNLLIDNNVVTVTTVGANEKIIGVAENSGSVGSNITVTNNTFNGDSGSLAGNQQVAFGITSQASSTATVTYTGNNVNGARDGFVWGDPEGTPAYDFTGPQYVPIAFSNTTLTNVGTGFFARDGGKATIASTTITNSGPFMFGTAFAADGNGTVITVTDPTTNYTGVSSLSSQTNGGLVIFLSNVASIQNVSKAEGNSGFTLFSFPVILAVAPSANQMFTVDFSTANGTADGNDYNTANGTLTFFPGQMSATVAVKVLGDFNPEPDETFFVNLSNPILTTNGSPAPGHLTSTQAIGTILNDDVTTIAVSIASATATKSATMGATTLMTFAATLNSAAPAGEFFTVNYHASNGTARGGVDYSAPDGTLTFLAGSTTPISPLTVTVLGSTAMNPPETFNVMLDTPLLHFTGFSQTIPGNIGNGTATGTIDSPPPSGAVVSVNSVAKAEGTPIPGNPASNFTTFTFTISYTGTLTTSIKVNWATANGSAQGGQDYQQNSGQVTLTPTVTSQTFSVTVFADKTVEPNETFSVNLTNPGLNGFSNYTLGTSTGIGTIVNDD